jgi:glycosyltransferase involved in cell wall biosynthesis
MMAKIVHANLNACGGSERLAIATIEALNEMGFVVDVETCTPLEIENLENSFGHLNINIRQVKQLDLLSNFLNPNTNASNYDSHYDVIINTHGDVLPYLYQNSNNNCSTCNTNVTDNNNIPYIKKIVMITYCHYPMLPYCVKTREYINFLRKYIKFAEAKDSNINNTIIDKLLSNAHCLYDLMMTNTIILTNSEFSKRAIKLLYKNIEEPIVLSPPVAVETFRRAALYSKEEERENTILVVSRFNPGKQVENAVRTAKILYEKKKIHYNMIIVGNISKTDLDYLSLLKNMIHYYGLKNFVKLEIGASFERLLHLMSKSKVYLHPLAGEPFGISVAEAMAAGLIPVVPHIGGNSEFVPERYHYSTLEEAAEIIKDALLLQNMGFKISNNKINNDTISEYNLRVNLSNMVLGLSTEDYKKNLRKIIGCLLRRKEKEEIPLLRQQNSQKVKEARMTEGEEIST